MPDLPDWTSAPVALFQTVARVTVTATELGDSGTVFVNNTGRSLVVTGIQIVAYGVDTKRIREVIAGNAGYGGTPPTTTIAAWAISPETPAANPSLDPASAVVPAGQNITWSATVMGGGGASTIRIAVTYYLGS